MDYEKMNEQMKEWILDIMSKWAKEQKHEIRMNKQKAFLNVKTFLKQLTNYEIAHVITSIAPVLFFLYTAGKTTMDCL